MLRESLGEEGLIHLLHFDSRPVCLTWEEPGGLMKITCWALFLVQDLVSLIPECSLCHGCSQLSIFLPGNLGTPRSQDKASFKCFDKHLYGIQRCPSKICIAMPQKKIGFLPSAPPEPALFLSIQTRNHRGIFLWLQWWLFQKFHS